MVVTDRIEVDWLFEQPGVKAPQEGAAIMIDGDKIASVTPLARSGRAGKAALPALVNAHDHGRSFRPVACGVPDQPLESWLSMLSHAPRADLYTQCVVAFGRMLLGGIGATAHLHLRQGGDYLEEAVAVTRAANDVGIRIAYGVPIIDTNAFVYGGGDAICGCHRPEDWSVVRDWDGRPLTARQQLDAADEIARYCSGPLVSVQYAPTAPQWLSDEGWRLVAERAAGNGRRLHTHLLETRVQREWADQHYPAGLLPYFDDLGLLSPRLTVAHCVWPSDAEITLLAERGVTVSVNTSSNLRLQSGIAPVRGFLRAGLAVAYGLDGMAFNDDEDALFELRLFSKLHAPTGFDGDGLSVADAWRAATTTGRRTIDDKADYGVLAVGADADLMVIDLDAMAEAALTELADPMDLIMTRARNIHVRDVFVAGRHVVANGKLTGVDLEAAERKLAEVAQAATPRLQPERALLGRHREIVRNHYLSGGHLKQRDG